VTGWLIMNWKEYGRSGCGKIKGSYCLGVTEESKE
jgi:hypothetical protein